MVEEKMLIGNLPNIDSERIEINKEAEKDRPWEEMSHEEKVAFVRGENKGYWKGYRAMAQQVTDKFNK